MEHLWQYLGDKKVAKAAFQGNHNLNRYNQVNLLDGMSQSLKLINRNAGHDIFNKVLVSKLGIVSLSFDNFADGAVYQGDPDQFK